MSDARNACTILASSLDLPLLLAFMNTRPGDLFVRPLSPSDDLQQITDLIRQAYAPHAARGLRYWGTHQTVEDTATRFGSGQGYVVEAGGEVVGTITVRPPQPGSPLALYRDTWSIVQFAVSPRHKGAGIGKLLHEAALDHALRHGAELMAIDTAAPAEALIAMYRAWGYRPVGEHSWSHTNYVSVVMTRSLVLADEAQVQAG